jgi:hypothetical protein
MPSNLLLLGKQYEAYVTVIAGEGDGPLIYIDHQGHIHIVPDGPDGRRIAEVLGPEISAVQKQLGAIAARVGELAGVPA